MGGDVGECLGQVVAAGYHVALAHNHGPYGHLVVPHGFLGLLQGQAHVFLVVAVDHYSITFFTVLPTITIYTLLRGRFSISPSLDGRS